MYVPDADAVPVIAPEEEFSESPGGSAPLDTVYV